ncbi:MAG: sugar phosphate isomerase/epimerase family protein [Gemmatimonadaceae bacterium]
MPTETRRSFLSTLAAVLGATAVGPRALAQRAAPYTAPLPPPIGLQLYTVRAAMKDDLPATLARVAAIGYREVEFAGYFDRTPAAIRDLLAANGLRSPASHIPFATIDAGWPAALRDARTIGHEWVVIPWLPPEVRRDADDWRRLAERYNRAATRAREAGLRFAHHNHDFELIALPDGTVPLEILLGATEPGLVDFELDVYWMVRAGGDPLDFVARHPGRFPLLHLKDSAGPPGHRMVDVGAGVIDFPRILAAARADGAAHAFVEHDEPDDPMRSIRASHDYLAKLAS